MRSVGIEILCRRALARLGHHRELAEQFIQADGAARLNSAVPGLLVWTPYMADCVLRIHRKFLEATEMKCFPALFTTAFLLTACGQPAIDEKVLRNGLEKYIAEHRADQCLLIDRFPWDAPVSAEPVNGPSGALRTRPPYMDLKQVAVLEKVGLVRRQTVPVGGDSPPRFELTDLGSKYYQEHEITDTVSGKGGVSGWLCYAQVALIGDMAWRRANPNMVFVDYRIEFKNVAPWATNPEMQAAFSDLEQEMVPGPVALQSKSFVHTRDGWVVALETGEMRTRVRRVK
jgi:hypothetical protein